jgi:hypothetical protein
LNSQAARWCSAQLPTRGLNPTAASLRLGIEAQRGAVTRVAGQSRLSLVGQLVKIETGKGADALDRRPILSQALEAARSAKCPVLVAKLDRLSRDVAFISGLRRNAYRSSWRNSARTPIPSCPPLPSARREGA